MFKRLPVRVHRHLIAVHWLQRSNIDAVWRRHHEAYSQTPVIQQRTPAARSSLVFSPVLVTGGPTLHRSCVRGLTEERLYCIRTARGRRYRNCLGDPKREARRPKVLPAKERSAAPKARIIPVGATLHLQSQSGPVCCLQPHGTAVMANLGT